MSFGEQYYRALQRPEARPPHLPSWIANYPPQKPAVDALEACGLASPCQVIANACASGTNAIGHAFECIRSGRYERVLTGGYDALSELVFVGFDSLQAATPEKCRPFDGARSGLVLGEGAALLALENLATAEARGARHPGGNHRLRHLDRQSSSHPAESLRDRSAPGDGTRVAERRRWHRRRSITSTRTEPRRRSTTRRKGAQSRSCSAAFPSVRPRE